MIKRCAVFLLLSLIVLVTGCSEEKTVIDVDKFNTINAYVNEILPAIEETSLDFGLWSEDLQNAEKIEWLKFDADRIEDINSRYLTGGFPFSEEVETWKVPVSNGDEKWTIKGDLLAPALEQMVLASEDVARLINQAFQANGENELFLTGKNEELGRALMSAQEAAETLAELFRKK